MAGRPPTYVSISLQDFVKLAYFYMSCVKQPNKVGECSLDEPVIDLLANVQTQSRINLRPEQLESLVYHYKQAVMNGLNPAVTMNLSEKEYQSILRSIQSWIPEYMKENRLGELVFKGFRSSGRRRV